LATESLTVTGTKESLLEVFESYPYEARLEEFLLINPNAERIDLVERPGRLFLSRSYRRITNLYLMYLPGLRLEALPSFMWRSLSKCRGFHVEQTGVRSHLSPSIICIN
jgi:hypothetical protein